MLNMEPLSVSLILKEQYAKFSSSDVWKSMFCSVQNYRRRRVESDATAPLEPKQPSPFPYCVSVQQTAVNKHRLMLTVA